MTGPLAGFLWIATAMASHLGIHLALPWQRTGLSPGLAVGIYLVTGAGSPAWVNAQYRHLRPGYPVAVHQAAPGPRRGGGRRYAAARADGPASSCSRPR